MGNERVASQFSYEQLNQALKKLAIDVAICRLSTTDKSHLRCHADEPAGSGLPETKNRRPKTIRQTFREVPPKNVYWFLLCMFFAFLLIGIFLTCYGFFYYETNLNLTKVARLAGIFAFLVSVGLLIAGFVTMSNCISRSFESIGDNDAHQLEQMQAEMEKKEQQEDEATQRFIISKSMDFETHRYAVAAICPSCSSPHIQELILNSNQTC
ncbi:hypothetical protein T07_5740 [Trichinella nelsoni]|uniref:Transmembrane protein n=1 Tax=Trichinella nelsoni TaxID=6336 RepID=A0A0V0S8H5_9BILA|nr:hypothetical protein T07_5740 [Trichinella nelsoni]